MKYYFKPNDNIINTVNTHAGFSPVDSIFELIDGSDDAGARTIEVTYKDSEKFPGTKCVVVKDNGSGFENPNTGIPSIITDFGGVPEDTSRTKHKAFGIGTRQTLTKLAKDGGYASVESNDGKTKAKYVTKYDGNGRYYMTLEENITLNTRGTIMTLDGIKTSDSVNSIYGKISVTYYSKSKENIGRAGLRINFNGNVVKFHDPLMRDLIDLIDDKNIARLETKIVKTPYGKYKVSTANFIHSGNTKKFFDNPIVADYLSKTPYEKNDGLKMTNSGRYINRNGRYIALGNGKHGLTDKGTIRSNGHNIYGTRTEIENIEPTKKSNNSTEFSTMNKNNDQTDALYGNKDHQKLWEQESELVTSSENHFKKVTGVDGKPRAVIDSIRVQVNEKMRDFFNQFLHDDYIGLSTSDSIDSLIPTTNGVKTKNDKVKVNWEIPISYRDMSDKELVEILFYATLGINNLKK